MRFACVLIVVGHLGGVQVDEGGNISGSSKNFQACDVIAPKLDR